LKKNAFLRQVSPNGSYIVVMTRFIHLKIRFGKELKISPMQPILKR